MRLLQCKFINIQQSTKTVTNSDVGASGCKFINIQQSTKTNNHKAANKRLCKFINIQQSTKTSAVSVPALAGVSLSISNRVLKPRH